jgi:hypothetical protein
MGHRSSISAPGQFRDREKRMSEFKKYFCHNRDNNGFLLEGFCSQTNKPFYSNVDIDYSRLMNRSKTLDIYFTDTDITGREQNVLALADNLFSNELMLRLPETLMQNNRRPDLLMDLRSIIAKRSVAEHSFHSQIGLRSQGPEASEYIVYPYIESMMQTVGLYYDNDEIAKMIGWDTKTTENAAVDGTTEVIFADEAVLSKQPSYDAQMELVTKIMYQNATFFTNLYDKPANVERQKAAMQAIGLMQDFDTWDSFLRTEAALAVLLELELMKLEDTEL